MCNIHRLHRGKKLYQLFLGNLWTHSYHGCVVFYFYFFFFWPYWSKSWSIPILVKVHTQSDPSGPINISLPFYQFHTFHSDSNICDRRTQWLIMSNTWHWLSSFPLLRTTLSLNKTRRYLCATVEVNALILISLCVLISLLVSPWDR